MRAAVTLSLVLAGAGLVLCPARPGVAAEVLPIAKVIQQVGMTEVSVEYECPAVQGRKIWGGLVPYDQPWLIGGASGAKIKFSKDVQIGSQAVPAGTYGLVALPGKSGWTLTLNKLAEPGATPRAYKPEQDVVRIRTAPKTVARRERLLFTFSDIGEDRASLDLEWDYVRVSLPIEVYTTQKILTSISGLDSTWRAFANAARYMLETARDYDAGLKYIDQALALKDDWYSMWIKGALYAAKGDFRSAREWAVKARELSEKAGDGAPLAQDLGNAIAEWTRKSGGVNRYDNEAQATKKVGDEPALNVAVRTEEAPPVPPAVVAKTERETSRERETTRPPAGDPPLMRRARLRRR